MPPEEKTEEKQDIKTPIKSLRTYQGDVEEAVQKNNFSATSIFTAEQNRKNGKLLQFEMPGDSKARNNFYLIVGSIMLLLGILTVSAVFYFKSREEVLIEQKTKALIGFSTEKVMSVASSTREQFVTDLLSEKKLFNLPVNSVLYINTQNELGIPEKVEMIISLLAPQMPPALVRSFEKEYMLGIYSFDTNEPFIILTTNDFANSFGGMLKWEKDMIVDFGKLFLLPQNGELGGGFKDETLRNKDLRILKSGNKTVLLYSFIDKNTLVITTNENILNGIVGKYNISKQIR